MSQSGLPATGPVEIGPVEIGPVAHGGHCVARLDGRVIFVRHGLPGEIALLSLTDTSHDSYWRADVVKVLQASPDRVPTRCAAAGPGRCGGCDFQHVGLAAQRRLKAAVVGEQLRRLAGLSWSGVVEPVEAPGTADGLGWRTRMRYRTDGRGRPGLHAYRSHEVVPVPEAGCPLAAASGPTVVGGAWPADAEIVTAVGGDGAAVLAEGRLVDGVSALRESVLLESGAERWFDVDADGFWQVHPAAATTLMRAVLAGLAPRPQDRALDLYCGVGLFSAALVDRGCRVWGVEADRSAVGHARSNVPGATFRAGRVEQQLDRLPRRADLVVLDPPRSGAGRRVLAAVAARRPRAVAYVACDPAALARDLKTAAGHGYRLESLRAFDLFPMTHHVECVAVLSP